MYSVELTAPPDGLFSVYLVIGIALIPWIAILLFHNDPQ